MRATLLGFLITCGCVHQIHESEYQGNDGRTYQQLICSQSAGPTGCVDRAEELCEHHGATLDSSSQPFDMPGIRQAEKVIPDPAMVKGRIKLIFHCNQLGD